MRSVVVHLHALALLASLAGCAGADFIRTPADALKNGQTTYAQVVEKMGPPRREGMITKNQTQLKFISYGYSTTGAKALHEGVVPGRVQTFFFYNDTLVGHEFVSSFAVDHSDFDDGKAANIEKGKTTRADVTRLLGNPSGAYIYPVIASKTGDAVVYLYAETRGDLIAKLFSKTLIVSFDPSGLVSNIEFTSSRTN